MAVWLVSTLACFAATAIYTDTHLGWHNDAEHIHERSAIVLVLISLGTLMLLMSRWSLRALGIFIAVGAVAASMSLGYERLYEDCCPILHVEKRGYPYGFLRHFYVDGYSNRKVEPVGALVNVMTYAYLAVLVYTLARWRRSRRLSSAVSAVPPSNDSESTAVRAPHEVRRTPTRWFVAVGAVTSGVAVCCAVMLWEQASRGASRNTMPAVGGLLIVGAFWLRIVVSGYRDRHNFALASVAPMMVVVTVATLLSGVAHPIAWRIARGPLEVAAATCVPSAAEQRFGLYLVIDIRPVDGGCQFRMSATDTAWSLTARRGHGFAYLPRGMPARPSQHSNMHSFVYSPHDGPWYRFKHIPTTNGW
ncbi:hypothetical protein [Nocardia salmonicida]|uniref:hypothetical protein n=1 Tax=Nocardia salmonicida TaxID=53431 RepID=UPI0037B6B066